MAVAENAPNFDDTALSGSHAQSDFENPKPRIDSSGILSGDPIFQSNGSDQNNQSRFQNQENTAVLNTFSVSPSNHNGRMQNGFDPTVVTTQQMVVMKSAGYGIDNNYNGIRNGDDGGENFKRDMRDLEELLSKLNPMAEEFVPPSLAKNHGCLVGTGFGYMNNLIFHDGSGNVIEFSGRRKKNGYTQGRKRNYHKMSPAQRESMIRRTVYVSDIDQQVTEENLAALFLNCGQVVDCRVCGDPNSILRFAFVEFTDEEGARTALNLSGTMLGYYPVKVLPSKTAIAPVNPTFLPRSNDEREMCSRTIYCTNIDKKVAQAEVKLFFETLCGEVQRLRLLGDYHHSTRIAFVEFTLAESAIAALNCSGVVLGSLPIRVSPSKTPVRPRTPRSPLH